VKTFTDQLNRTIQLPNWPPRRIVSLVPSQTELLHYLGLDEEIAGITKFCVHPEHWRRQKTKVGGTKKFHIDRVRELQPDLIIGNKEENEREQIKKLAEQYPVWLSDVRTLPDAYRMITQIGKLVKKEEQSSALVNELNARFSRLEPLARKPRVVYFIWREPYMVAGNETFIHEMIQQAGFENAFRQRRRYPTIQLEDLQGMDFDYVFLSSEPYPFQPKHFEEFTPFCQQAVIKIVDGELFSWYGSRLLRSAEYFRTLRNELMRS